MLPYVKPGPEKNVDKKDLEKKMSHKRNKIVEKIEHGLVGTLLNSKFIRNQIQGVTEKKNRLASERSRENLSKLISDEIKRLKCGDHFRIYKKDGESDTIVLDLTRNLGDFQVISKSKVLDLLVDEVAEIVTNLKSNRDVLGDFHKLELTSWIFGERHRYRLRENITNKLAASIPELDKAQSKLMKMTIEDKIGTMGVYPHDFLNILHHKSKGKLLIDLDKSVNSKQLLEKGNDQEKLRLVS